MTQYLNLKGKHFTVPEAPNYYSLETNRVHHIKKTGLIYDDTYRIAGTADEIEDFKEINGLDVKATPSGLHRMMEKLHLAPVAKTCPLSDPVRSRNIEKIPADILDNLCEFNLFGLRGRCKIVDIIDGDTVSMCFFVPIDFLREINRSEQSSALIYGEAEGLYLRWRVRLMGIDATELHGATRENGKLAKQILQDIVERHRGFLDFHILQFDKYGRILVEFFLSDGRNINEELLRYPNLFKSYEGGTKKVFD
jgi:endonuclease YncB( thermonuclease family)